MTNLQIFPVRLVRDDKKDKWRKVPAISKDNDWHTYKASEKEIEKAKNIGIVIPKGLICIDVDFHKGGIQLSDIDEALGCELDWDEAEAQETISGGKHYFFTVPEDRIMRQGSDLLGVIGFDTRTSGKGWIASGDGYTDLTMLGLQGALDICDFPELPEDAVLSLDAVAMRDIQDSSDDLMDMLDNEKLDISMKEVEAYMNKLTPEHAANSDTWLEVGMALSHQTDNSEQGWRLFDKFSRLAMDCYDEKMNRRRWDSFANKPKGKVKRFGTVITLVGGKNVIVADKFEDLRQQVMKAEDRPQLEAIIKEAATLPLDEINTTLMVKALQNQFKEVIGEKLTEQQVRKILRKSRPKKHGDFHEDYVFLTSTGEYMDRATKTCMGPRAFDVKHGRDTPADGEGNPQRATSYADNFIECVHSGMYAPMFGETFLYDGVDYFNTYKPCTVKRKPVGEVVEKVKAHIAHLLPNEDEQQIVIDYLAHNVQNPGKKILWAIILQGVQGDGKSFLAEMMRHVLGQSNCKTVSVESLDEKFTPWAEGSCMVFIEELKLDNYKKYETLNKLKPYISNPTVPVRKMRVDTYEAVNTTNYFALTNFKDALPIDDNDRRYCVLFSQWQSKEKLVKWMEENPDYYPDLYEAMREGVGEIIEWLATHQVSAKFKAMTRAPETRAKQMMADMAKGDDWLMVEDAIAKFECDDINEHVVNITKLYEKATDMFEDGFKDFPKTKRMRNIMLEMGYHAIGRYKDSERKNQTIYCRDDSKSALEFKPD